MKPDLAALAAQHGPTICDGRLGRHAVMALTGLTDHGARTLLAMLNVVGKPGRPLAGAGVPAPAATPAPAPAPTERFTHTERQDDATLEVDGTLITNVDELLTRSGVDLNLWEVTQATVNAYQSSRKNAASQLTYAAGVVTGSAEDKGGMFVQQLYSVKIWLKRREDAARMLALRDDVLSDIRAAAARAPRVSPVVARPAGEGNLLYLGLHDLHPAKVAVLEEVGMTWSAEEAEALAIKVITRALEKAARSGIERIVLPVGHDLAHVENTQGTTSGGTPQQTSQTYRQMRRFATRLQRRLVDACLQLAPVDIHAVPGNHGRETDLTIADMMAAIYDGHPHVTVTAPATARSYRQHGVNLLGLTHGDKIKPDQLGLLMAAEEPALWAKTQQREWLLGHYHIAKLYDLLSGKDALRDKILRGTEVNGVRVRYLPSITATDYWHAQHGYTQSQRALEAYIYNAEYGYEGQINVPLREVS